MFTPFLSDARFLLPTSSRACADVLLHPGHTEPRAWPVTQRFPLFLATDPPGHQPASRGGESQALAPLAGGQLGHLDSGVLLPLDRVLVELSADRISPLGIHKEPFPFTLQQLPQQFLESPLVGNNLLESNNKDREGQREL